MKSNPFQVYPWKSKIVDLSIFLQTLLNYITN
ncbi:hypothetical protein NIES2100_46860 [Calothrix sp. NIES-2100]|nr:hypothetical protein NIES2100_46860 [Calothrix sp. NIES-2100]